MNRVVIGCVLATAVGCSSHETASSAPQLGSAASTSTSATDPAMFFTLDVTSVLRGPGQDFPIVAFVSTLIPSPPDCWTKLRAAIRDAYQLTPPGGGSYFVFEGALPQAEVEDCVSTAFGDALPVHITHDGELVAIDAGPAGTAYAAWRGSVIIVGKKPRVVEALATNAPDTARTWRERLAALPRAPMAIWSGDALIANLFGIRTTSYMMVFDHVEKTPRPSFAGRVIVQYANAADAAQAAARIQAGALDPALAAPAALVDAFKRMQVTQTGTTVTFAFSMDTFAGVDLAMLQKWLAGVTARKAVATGSSPADASVPSPVTASTCEQLEPILTPWAHHEVYDEDPTKDVPDAKLRASEAAVVAAAITVCTRGRWSAQAIQCFATGVARGDGSADACVPAADLERLRQAEEAAFQSAVSPASK